MKIRLCLDTILRDWNEETRYGTPTRVGPKTGTSSGDESVQLSVINRMVVDQVLADFPARAEAYRTHMKAVCDSCDRGFGGVEGWDEFETAVLAKADASYRAFRSQQ